MSTRVGGVPEVLPLGRTVSHREQGGAGYGESEEESMIMFAAPEEDGEHPFEYRAFELITTRAALKDLIQATSYAIQYIQSGLHSPEKAHERVKNFYSWEDVTERTECVYNDVMSTEPYAFWARVRRCVARCSNKPDYEQP